MAAIRIHRFSFCYPMKKSIFLLVLLGCYVSSSADLTDAILSNRYAPKTLSAAYMDSVLNGKSDQRYQLRYENATTRFRHSKEADWYLQDTQKGKKIPIGRGREAQMSPNGRYVVYVKDRTPWIYKVDFQTEVVMTHEDSEQIYGGASDWLYEEEFGVTRLFCFSPDSRMVAFVRLDEAPVPTFSWQEYMDGDEMLRYPITQSLRYPKAGDENARATVCVYDIQTKAIQTMKIGGKEDDYLPRLCWRTIPNPKAKKGEPKEGYELLVERLNRDQNEMEVLACNPRSTVVRSLYREQSDEFFVDYSLFDSWQFLSDGRFIALSERNGWRQLFLYAQDGTPLRCLTPQPMDITAVYGVDESAQSVYFQAAPTPMTRQVYALQWRKSTLTQLTSDEGIHQFRFSNDRKRAIDHYQDLTTPSVYTLYSIQKQQLTKQSTLLTNDSISALWKQEKQRDPEFFQCVTERGDTLNGTLLFPPHFEPTKRYPVVLMQYSGPASQRVLDRWSKRFEYVLAKEGYIVVCVDPRGTDNRGRAFRNATYKQLGVKEAEDHISAARYLSSLSYVDADRLCIGGWSYGGFQTIMTMSRKDSPFRCGFAIAPVTDWTLYDTGYTERYMLQPKENDRGYDAANLRLQAADLKGRLLLVHGLADDNVHAQHTLMYADALVQAGVQFDMQIYPDDNHFLRKRNNYRHLHERLLRFLKENL